jgi:hypothetical protein
VDSSLSQTTPILRGGTGATTKAAAFDALSPITAAGDLIYGDANGVSIKLPPGTVDQVLTMNIGATAPEWKTNTAATNIDGLSDGKSDGNSVFLGTGAGTNDNGGLFPNTGIGFNALNAVISGIRNVGIGDKALSLNTSNDNTAVGTQALQNNTTGLNNVAIGTLALMTNSTASQSTAVGFGALKNSNGQWNVALGNNTLSGVTTGINNLAVGTLAGNSVITGSGNIFLGHNAGFSELGSNKLYIENTNSATPLIYGEFNTNLVRINGKLQVTGVLEVTGAATNTVALDFGNNTTINFALSNIAYTNTTSATITLNGLKNGGAYTLACTATMVSNEVTFTAAGFTFRAMGTAARTNGKVHLYSFIVAGTQVYVSMATEN